MYTADICVYSRREDTLSGGMAACQAICCFIRGPATAAHIRVDADRIVTFNLYASSQLSAAYQS